MSIIQIATKKPVIVECFQFTKELRKLHYDEFPAWFMNIVEFSHAKENEESYYYIPTLEGNMIISENDVIVKGVHGEVYPVKPAIFRDSYDFDWELKL